MKLKEIVKDGYVAELNGKYWGIIKDEYRKFDYDDCEFVDAEYGFTDIDKAKIFNKQEISNIKSLSYSTNPEIKSILNANWINIKKTITYETME